MKKLWYLMLVSFAVSCGQTAQANEEEDVSSVLVIPLPEDPSRPMPSYGYPFPDFDHKSGDLPMGMPYEPREFK